MVDIKSEKLSLKQGLYIATRIEHEAIILSGEKKAREKTAPIKQNSCTHYIIPFVLEGYMH